MKKTKSICPVCHNLIDAVIFDNDNKTYIEKNCEDHGTFRDVYWGDTEQYYRFEKYLHDGNGIANHLFLIKKDAHMTAVYVMCTRQIPFLRILMLPTVAIYAVQYVLPMQPLQAICMNPQLNKSMK